MKGARLGVDATGKPYAAGGRYGLYFRERLGASRTSQAAGEIEPSGEGQTSYPRGRRWWVLVVLALVIGIILGVVLAHARELTRGDLFDAQGRRTGYAVVWGHRPRRLFYTGDIRAHGRKAGIFEELLRIISACHCASELSLRSSSLGRTGAWLGGLSNRSIS